MTGSDRPAFASCLARICIAYNRELDEALISVYADALSDLDLHDIETATSACIRTERFFPTPAALRESILGSPKSRALTAWHTLKYAAINGGFFDLATNPQILAAVNELGGFQRTYAAIVDASEDEYSLNQIARDFSEAYVSCLSQPPHHAPHISPSPHPLLNPIKPDQT